MVDPQQGQPASGRVARVAPLAGLAGRTAGEAVVASLRKRRGGSCDRHAESVEFHTRTAQRYAERLGRSRGVLMKAGQILSVLLPDSGVENGYRGIYQAAFARLQDDVPPMPAQTAIDTVTTELGRSLAELYTEFDPHPLAAASIGQVHAARLPDGRDVAVKIQYPGVEEAIRADLRNTELLATFLQMLVTVMPSLTKLDVRAMAAEISDRIGEEIDYRVEAANQREFADAYRGHPFIRIPEVIPELCGRRVLTMDLVDGLRYAKATCAEQGLRDRWGEVIFRFCLGSLHKHGLINTDMHPGNYLFHPDGTVTFLDFGSVKRMTEGHVQRLFGWFRPTLDRDLEAMGRASVELGFIDPADPPDPHALLAWREDVFGYLLPPQPFTVTPQYVAATVRARMSPTSPHRELVRKMTVDTEFTMSLRMDLGMIAALGGLRATGLWKNICAEWVEAAPPATHYGELAVAFETQRSSRRRKEHRDG